MHLYDTEHKIQPVKLKSKKIIWCIIDAQNCYSSTLQIDLRLKFKLRPKKIINDWFQINTQTYIWPSRRRLTNRSCILVYLSKWKLNEFTLYFLKLKSNLHQRDNFCLIVFLSNLLNNSRKLNKCFFRGVFIKYQLWIIIHLDSRLYKFEHF